MKYKFAIVTPVKDEEKYFVKTIDSVLSQEYRPQKWIIINDGSTDRTGEIVEELGKKNDWVEGIHIRNHSQRKPGGESVLDIGIKRLNLNSYDFFVRMDGDLSFDKSYFKRLFSKFEQNPKLGIASGVCYAPSDGKLIEEKHPRFHTRGPLKTYRIQCYFDIGGVERCLGWDTIDEIKSNMLGWQTRSFPDLKIVHLRKTQTASGVLNGIRNIGITSYSLGYHPIFMFLRAIKRMTKPPFFIGGGYMLYCFIGAYFKGDKQINHKKFITYLRRQQLNRVLGRNTIWK